MLTTARFKPSSFAPAFLCLGPRRRAALAAVYSFAREVDDAVDEVGLEGGDPDRARRLLAAWRDALHGRPPSAEVPRAVWRPLEKTLSQFSVDRSILCELVDGVERDLTQTRYETWEDLKGYCFGVAGTVGLSCLPIFGLDQVRHRDFAVTLGQAVQLVNILRDVKTDALRNRIYLPQEDLRRFGLGDSEILGRIDNKNFRDLMKFEADRARVLFDVAWAALPREDRSAGRPALAMGRIYRRLLEKMERSQFQVFTQRYRLNFLEKLLSLVGSNERVDKPL